MGDALDGLERVVQIARLRGGGVDADADQRIDPARAEDVTVFGVEIGHIEPGIAVVGLALAGERQALFKIQHLDGLARAARDMHQRSASMSASARSVCSQRTPSSSRPMWP